MTLTFDNASSSLLVQALGISLLDCIERRLDVDLDEGKSGRFVQSPGHVSVGLVWGDEGGDSACARCCEELCDLCVKVKSAG